MPWKMLWSSVDTRRPNPPCVAIWWRLPWWYAGLWFNHHTWTCTLRPWRPSSRGIWQHGSRCLFWISLPYMGRWAVGRIAFQFPRLLTCTTALACWTSVWILVNTGPWNSGEIFVSAYNMDQVWPLHWQLGLGMASSQCYMHCRVLFFSSGLDRSHWARPYAPEESLGRSDLPNVAFGEPALVEPSQQVIDSVFM